MSKYGRIYLPDTKQCLAVKNADSPTGPYYVERRACLNSAAGEMTTAASIPQNWLDQRGFLSWVGKSNANSTVLQGNCKAGDFGYAMDKHGIPLSDKSGEYRVSLICIYNGPNTPLNSAFWTTQT
ncbi:hypothetical protein BS47DRAFT_1345010 [Hydnum rufescens UP504]|uniref:Uncharacterized protein n=1 Tax=Hydnum rufescens UP504 TaxID=1448309 RepID=A0A9P6DVK1_9AGAM|nr:hypothetical protein BS47DRAFT_1345010 [Hydnum rufescens UP504]